MSIIVLPIPTHTRRIQQIRSQYIGFGNLFIRFAQCVGEPSQHWLVVEVFAQWPGHHVINGTRKQGRSIATKNKTIILRT